MTEGISHGGHGGHGGFWEVVRKLRFVVVDREEVGPRVPESSVDVSLA
jgi:hypothetical protein